MKLISALATIALMASPVAAAAQRVTVPSELRGSWCRTGAATQGPVLYKRGDCARGDDGWIVIGPRGYEGTDGNCTMGHIASHRRKGIARKVYTVLYFCPGEGGTEAELINMYLGEGNALVVENAVNCPNSPTATCAPAR